MTLDEQKAVLIARLEVGQETLDPCAHGHVDHTAADHVGRRLVHTMAGPFGADWDYDDAVAFIQRAARIAPDMGVLHYVQVWAPEGRAIAFAVTAAH